MIKVVGYVRVSSEDQAQKDLSIPAQIKAIERHVAEQPDVQLLQIFRDEGISAYAPADKRHGFMAMIKFAKENSISHILVHKLDRFSRNREESILFKSLLKKQNVTVKSLTENYDPDTPSGFLFEGIIEVINQFYSMNLAMETRKGMAENASRGFSNGGVAPYGYAKMEVPGIGDRVHKKLTLGDPVAVATVRKIFEWSVNEGIGVKGIVNKLNAEGIIGPNGKPWCKQRIGQLLNTHAYYGATVWNRTCTKTRKPKPESEWMIVENTHEHIVSKELFFKRKQLAESNIGNAFQISVQKEPWLLAKMIRCGKCGKAFVGIRRKKVSKLDNERIEYLLKRYVCSGHINQNEGACSSFYIDKDYLENAVLRAIQHEITKPGRLDELEQQILQQLESLHASKSEEELRVQAKLDEIDTSIQRYFKAIAAGIDLNECKNQIEVLQGQKKLLENEFKQKFAVEELTVALRQDLDVCRKLARNFEEEATTIPFERLRLIVVHFVESIEIVDQKVAVITLRIPKLTAGKSMKPPMSKKTKAEIQLANVDKTKCAPDLNQVRTSRLPSKHPLDVDKWLTISSKFTLLYNVAEEVKINHARRIVSTRYLPLRQSM